MLYSKYISVPPTPGFGQRAVHVFRLHHAGPLANESEEILEVIFSENLLSNQPINYEDDVMESGDYYRRSKINFSVYSPPPSPRQ